MYTELLSSANSPEAKRRGRQKIEPERGERNSPKAGTDLTEKGFRITITSDHRVILSVRECFE